MKWLFCTTITTLLVSSTSSSPLGKDELSMLVESLKGDDDRLFRPDATEHTVEQQHAGDCAKLVDAAKLVASLPAGEEGESLVELAAEYASFCVVENPENSAAFADADPHLHQAVVTLVGSENPWVSTSASRLIYISSFANEKSHGAYFHAGAVEALGHVIMNEDAVAVQRMYAAAALQNLAASYCKRDTGDTYCQWTWTDDEASVQLDPSSSLLSDGSAVREHILESEGLVDSLVALSCQEPIRSLEESDEAVVMPGSTAVEGEHSDLNSLVTFAAISVLRDLALEPSAVPVLTEKGALECACHLRESADWLESSRSNELLFFARRADNPCWATDDQLDMCVDANFFDGENTCDAFPDTEDLHCEESVDKFTGLTAAEMCCGCGGGATWIREEESEEM